MKILSKYLIFISIPYVLAKYIKEYFWENTSPQLKQKLTKKLKGAKDLKKISDPAKDILDRGYSFYSLTIWFAKIIM